MGIVAASRRPQYVSELENLAKTNGIPFWIQPKQSDPQYADFLQAMQNLTPDWIIVNSYSMKIPVDLLNLPRHYAINVHWALLPQYRGANPVQWAIINGERESGVTMHLMTESFDEGNILAQHKVPFNWEETWLDAYKQLNNAAGAMLRKELPCLLRNELIPQPQDETQARYFHRRHPEDGEIAWEQPLIKIYHLVRALVAPMPGAFYKQQELVINLDTYHTLPQLALLKSKNHPYSPGNKRQFSIKPLRPEDIPFLRRCIQGDELYQQDAETWGQLFEQETEQWYEGYLLQNQSLLYVLYDLNAVPYGCILVKKPLHPTRTAKIEIILENRHSISTPEDWQDILMLSQYIGSFELQLEEFVLHCNSVDNPLIKQPFLSRCEGIIYRKEDWIPNEPDCCHTPA